MPLLPLRASVRVGTVVDGRYRIRARIGGGGMGEVYDAIDPDGTLVAVKVIRRVLAIDATALGRFAAEARALQRVSHRNVVAFRASGTHRGLPYLVMERVDGTDLQTILLRAPDRRLAIARALRIMQSICDGVQALHDAGVVHHDLKASNVLLAVDGRAVIGDLGMARPLSSSCRVPAGRIEGTPAYLAPELVVGVAANPSPAMDVYALGVLATKLLTGRCPFEGSPTAVLRAHVSERPPRPSSLRPGISSAVDDVILWALAKDPDRRPADATELQRALGSAALPRRRFLDRLLRPLGPRHSPTRSAAAKIRPTTVGSSPAMESSTHAGLDTKDDRRWHRPC